MTIPLYPLLTLAAALVVQPLADEGVLEPSVQNEVDHAIAKCGNPKCAAAGTLPFSTNGLSRTQLAIRFVSKQKADGRWVEGTNDYSAVAVRLLRSL